MLNLTDILMGLQFFYPFEIHLRNRGGQHSEDADGMDIDSERPPIHFQGHCGRRNVSTHNDCKATVFDIKLEPAHDPKAGQGAILWMFACFNDHFYFDAKQLLHDMRMRCQLISEDDHVEYPYGILSEMVYYGDNGMFSLQDLLLHKEDANVFTFPWPSLAVSKEIWGEMRDEVNRFVNRDGLSTGKEKFLTTDNLRKVYANPYQTDVQFPSKYSCWRGSVLIDEKLPASTNRGSRRGRSRDRTFEWTHRGFIISTEDQFGNKCCYIHPKLTMYFHSIVFGGKDENRDQHRYCVRNIYPLYSKKTAKTQEEYDDALRKELLYYVQKDFAKPRRGETWISLKDVIILFLNNPVRLPYEHAYTTTSYDSKSKVLLKELRVALSTAPWKSMREDGIIKVDNLSVSPFQYQKHAVLVWTESKQELYVRKVTHEEDCYY